MTSDEGMDEEACEEAGSIGNVDVSVVSCVTSVEICESLGPDSID